MKKKFDCVALQDHQAARIRKETANLTRSKELAYWAEKENSLRSKVSRSNPKRKTTEPTTASKERGRVSYRRPCKPRKLHRAL
jgi:hypothetical protein